MRINNVSAKTSKMVVVLLAIFAIIVTVGFSWAYFNTAISEPVSYTHLVGAIKKIADIAKTLKDKGVDKVIVMSGKHAYKATGAWDYVEKALNDNGIGYVNFAEVTPNPNTCLLYTSQDSADDICNVSLNNILEIFSGVLDFKLKIKALKFKINFFIIQVLNNETILSIISMQIYFCVSCF